MTDKDKKALDKASPADQPPKLSTSIVMSNDPKADAEKSRKSTADVKKSTTNKPSAKSSNNVKSTASSTRQKPQETTKKAMSTSAPTKKSPLAVIAFLIAIIALAGLGGYYWWHQQEQLAFQQALTTQNDQQINSLQLNLRAEMNHQNQTVANQLKSTLVDREQRLATLEKAIASLSAQQPSDWLVNEAEYLIRIAARTLWLEQNTTTAIALLKDAEQKLIELKDPKYLLVRQAIYHDISELNLLPKLATESVIMSLMGLAQQIEQLRFNHVYIPETSTPQQDLTLSEDTADWRSNLAKTWQRFLNDFITVNRRTGNVEPLMTPQHQQNLQANLALKLQLAQWAAAEQNNVLYQKTLDEIILWLKQYFAIENDINQRFISNITALKSEVISAEFPTTLTALTAIRKQLSEKDSPSISLEKKSTQKVMPATSNQTTTESLTEALLQPKIKKITEQIDDKTVPAAQPTPSEVKQTPEQPQPSKDKTIIEAA